jgi:plastocyanin
MKDTTRVVSPQAAPSGFIPQTMSAFPPPRIGTSPAARLTAVAAALVLITAACTGATAPTASPTEPPATASPSPSPEVTPAATPTTAAPTLIPYPGPAIPAGTLTLQVVAKNIAFDVSDLTAPATTPFVIHFDNEDAGVAHNVAIKLGDDFLFKPLPAIQGVATVDYYISGGLAAGEYMFLCTVHPGMHGTLTIQ